MKPFGLPPSAWTNRRTMVASAWPDDPVVGDRVLRTDVGSIPTWFTYHGIMFTFPQWIADSLSGTATFNSVTPVSSITQRVEFGTIGGVAISYPYIPAVYTNIMEPTNGLSRWSSNAMNIDGTGFTLTLSSPSAATSVAMTNLPVRWTVLPR